MLRCAGTPAQIEFASGDTFDGQLREDHLHHGVYVHADSAEGRYHGHFDVDSLKDDKDGVQFYGDGSVYRGQFRHGSATGQASKRYPVPEKELDGHVYTGEFLDAKRHGKGKVIVRARVCAVPVARSSCSAAVPRLTAMQMVWCKGEYLEYVGLWADDDITGAGVMKYRNGKWHVSLRVVGAGQAVATGILLWLAQAITTMARG